MKLGWMFLCAPVALALMITGRSLSEEQTRSKKEVKAVQLTSSAFKEGGPIPTRHTCDGEDLSPPLKWTSVPPGTRGLALICDDPDAPVGTWVHWVLYGLGPTATELKEGVPATEKIPGGAIQGINDFKRLGYGGPCPPRGPAHRYFFKLYALDTEITLKPRSTKNDLLRAMEGHILSEGKFMGTYRRK